MNKKEPWAQPIALNTENTIMQCMPNLNKVKLLDFGAGYGRYLNMFAKYIDKDDLYGAEIEDESRQIILEQGFQCYQPDFNVPVIPYEDEFFDYIFTSNVLEHIPYKYYKEYLKEFYRVLKKGGRVLFGAPNYPFKRLYDIGKALRTKLYRYYLLDDPTHISKLSIYQYENDFKAYFKEVHFDPSFVWGENRISFIRRNRYKLRLFGDKIFGYCIK